MMPWDSDTVFYRVVQLTASLAHPDTGLCLWGYGGKCVPVGFQLERFNFSLNAREICKAREI